MYSVAGMQHVKPMKPITKDLWNITTITAVAETMILQPKGKWEVATHLGTRSSKSSEMKTLRTYSLRLGLFW